MTSTWAELSRGSADHLALRSIVAVGAAVAVAMLWIAGDGHGVFLASLAFLGLAAAMFPHRSTATVFIVAVVISWFAITEPSFSPWVLICAWALMLVHVGGALVAGMPPQAALPARIRRIYLIRLAIVAGISAGVWGISVLFRAIELPGGPIPATIALLIIASAAIAHYFLVTRAAIEEHTHER